MGDMIEMVAFDGDDTLWHNESIFSLTQERFRAIVGPYVSAEVIDERLFTTETENLRLFGYGVKSFTLSMIETAIQLTEGRLTAREVQAIIDAGRDMLEHPVDLLFGVADAVDRVSETHPIMLITKGDLLDQESKLARSGLGERFEAIEIVSAKNPQTYERILTRHGVRPDRFVMVGDSLRSDIEPVLATGGYGVHVPYHLVWAHETVDDDGAVRSHPRYRHLDTLDDLPALIGALES
jgi:putative hydrolase of the HAD superfamily